MDRSMLLNYSCPNLPEEPFISALADCHGLARRCVQVENKVRSERIVKILGEEEARQVIEMTILAPKSAAQVSKELGIPSRSVYRHINDLCEVGLLARDRSILIDSGGKCALYRSMVKSVGFRYEPLRNTIEVDLVPNDTILDKFLNFWKYMSSV